MIESLSQRDQLLKNFPLLRDATSEFREDFFNHATMLRIPQGYAIANEGSTCSQLALVVSGKVRVYKLGESGREITLYRIGSGDSCVLTASCVMSDTPFPAIAQSETDVEAVVVPSIKAREWMTESKSWNGFIFGLISKRLADVITVLEEVTFLHMDERIATYLLALAGQGDEHHITHHQIAADLGTSREVVSRILKDFENKRFVEIGRGILKTKDIAGLKAFRH
jgi:CRP/FNR family transcriptional regulator